MRDPRLTEISTTILKREKRTIVRLTAKAKSDKDDYKPRNIAEFVRAAVRFALDNPEQFKIWMERKWDQVDQDKWDEFIRETT